MKPVKFKESNKTLTAPNALTDIECGDLNVWTDGRQTISLWRPSFREWLSILIHGRIWLGVFSGQTQPPVWIEAKVTPFISKKAQKKIDKKRIKEAFDQVNKAAMKVTVSEN